VEVAINGGVCTSLSGCTPTPTPPPAPAPSGCTPKKPVSSSQFYVYDSWEGQNCETVGTQHLCFGPLILDTDIAPLNDWNCDWVLKHGTRYQDRYTYSSQWPDDEQPDSFTIDVEGNVCDVSEITFTRQCDG